MDSAFRTFFVEVRATLAVLVLIVPLVAYFGWDVQHRVAQSSALQAHIRSAQLLRGRVLRLQIDEETGERGFDLTKDRSFLAPYIAGRRDFPVYINEFRAELAILGFSNAARLVAEEDALNARWLREVAEPIIAQPERDNRQRQLAGKAIVDAFRAHDDLLIVRLNERAIAADGRLNRAIDFQIAFDAVLVVIFAAGGLIFAYFLSRSARRAFETRMLYQNQKRIAESLQKAFLQKSLPTTPGIGLHAMYVPATSEAQVGGDWYDAFTLPDGRLLFSIGDVAGHGIDAAVVMNRARQAIVAAALQEDDPARVLQRANVAIMLQDSRMVTAICGFIDPAKREIAYATAGHPAPVLVEPNAHAMFLPHEGVPLGIVAAATYRTFIASAAPDSLVAFYTDGVLEHKRDIFAGERRLLAAVTAARDRDDPASAIHDAIFGGAEAADDVAIFTVSFRTGDGSRPAAAKIDALQGAGLRVASTVSTASLALGGRPSC